MSSLSVPVKVMVSFALLPPGSVWSKATCVLCFSASFVSFGLLEMTSSPAVILVEWILSSLVLTEMEVLSSTTSRLEGDQHGTRLCSRTRTYSMVTEPQYVNFSKSGSRVRS